MLESDAKEDMDWYMPVQSRNSEQHFFESRWTEWVDIWDTARYRGHGQMKVYECLDGFANDWVID